ncbi:MAG: gliding motility lipoprotein GldD [Bacteroidetes bacterium]|nr:MAG: gliding motility lipoprotein GldD [Bacteroidota bacterium]
MMRLALVAFVAISLTACTETFTPRPKAFFHIDIPQPQYQRFASDCPFSFNVAQYGFVMGDSSANAEPCWLNVQYPMFNATVHLTYKPIGQEFSFEELQKDSRTLVYKHTIKAQEIMENTINKPDERVYGMLYRLTGDAATSLQFYVTDSTSHYLRGVLYFNQHTDADSIAPVLNHLSDDVLEMVGSLNWK